MRWMLLAWIGVAGLSAAELQQLPADRAKAWRITLDEDGNRALEFNKRRILTEGHIDFAYYTYHAVMRVDGMARRFGGSESIGVRGGALRKDHAALKGEVLAFRDFVRYEFRNKQGAISADGKAKTEPVYDDLFALASGHVIAKQGEREGALDAKLKLVVPMKYERLAYLGGGRFGGGLKGRFGVFDAAGKVTVQSEHDTLSDHHIHGVHLIGSSRKNLAGVINAKGELVYEPRFKIVRAPDVGAGRVFVTDTQTGQQGYINSEARFVPNTAIQAYFREWRVAPDDPGRAVVYRLARAAWEDAVKRYKDQLPPGKAPGKLHTYPAEKDFKMELHLRANGKGALHVGLSQSLVEWNEKDGVLELKLYGILAGRARVTVKEGRLVYEQLTRTTRAGKLLENPLPQPVRFEKKPVTLTTRDRVLELVYAEKGPHDKPRRMQFLGFREGGVGVEITDEFGIGQGTLRLARGNWPAKLQLRLRLKGLEGIRVTVGQQVLPREALNIRLLDPTGKPLEGKHRLNRPGYYEATIPPAAIKGAKEIKISWVDFYR